MPETTPTTRGEIAALASAARHYADHGRLEEARDVYAGLIELEPDVSYLHTGLGCVLMRLGCAGDALACFHAALRLDPEKPGDQKELMQIQLKLQRIQQVVSLINEIRKARHSMAMAVINNIN